MIDSSRIHRSNEFVELATATKKAADRIDQQLHDGHLMELASCPTYAELGVTWIEQPFALRRILVARREVKFLQLGVVHLIQWHHRRAIKSILVRQV